MYSSKIEEMRSIFVGIFLSSHPLFEVKDVRGWQFSTIEAAEALCMVCLPPDEIFFRNRYLSNRPFFFKIYH